jgi:hypothetical protein
MLPFVPLTLLQPQNAKRLWILLGILFLAASIALLSRLSGLTALEVLVLALLAHSAIGNNFLIGQYYIFLLLLVTCGVGCLLRGREELGGALLGLVFALKLYTAPFLLLFAARRQWRAFWGFAGLVAGAGVLTITIFGRRAVWFFATTVMLRGMDGSINDPYNPGWASMTAFLRHSLITEAELNPYPLIQAPALFYFLRTLYTLGVFVLSPNTASYHYVLLVVPVALLLKGASRLWGAGLIVLYIAVELPLYSWDVRYFPKAWLLLALTIYAGSRCWCAVRPWALAATVTAVAAVAAGDTVHRMRLFRIEPPQVAARAATEVSSNFSSFAAFAKNGLIYQAMGRESHVIRGAGASDRQEFSFDGDAFHPAPVHSGEAVYFELASHGHSQIARLQPASRDVAIVVGPEWNPTEPAISPDGTKLAFVSGQSLYLWEGDRRLRLATGEISAPAFFPDGSRLAFAYGPPGRRNIAAIAVSGGELDWLVRQGDCTEPAISPNGFKLAFACEDTGAEHIRVQDLFSGKVQRITNGACSNRAPAWSLDSRTIVFASDCSRGLGLPALYQVAIN